MVMMIQAQRTPPQLEWYSVADASFLPAVRFLNIHKQYVVEHPEARKHRWVWCIDGRNWKLVRNAG